MTDKDGDIVQHYGYQPYGQERYRDNTSAFSVSNRYTGQTLDAETGLYYYYGARYYDPEIARFIQADTTIPDPEFSQAYNRYAYVYNNPLKFTDPTGQDPFSIAYMLIAGAISGGVSAVTGGDFFRGFILGAFSYGLGVGAAQLATSLGLTGTIAAVFTGTVVGATMGLMTGGNPLEGAAAGALTAWAVRGVFKIDPGLWDDLPTEKVLAEYTATLIVETGVGGVVQGKPPESALVSIGSDALVMAAEANFLSNEGESGSPSAAPLGEASESGFVDYATLVADLWLSDSSFVDPTDLAFSGPEYWVYDEWTPTGDAKYREFVNGCQNLTLGDVPMAPGMGAIAAVAGIWLTLAQPSCTVCNLLMRNQHPGHTNMDCRRRIVASRTFERTGTNTMNGTTRVQRRTITKSFDTFGKAVPYLGGGYHGCSLWCTALRPSSVKQVNQLLGTP